MSLPQQPPSVLDYLRHLRLPDFAGMALAFVLLVPYLALENSLLAERILLAIAGVAAVGWCIVKVAHWRIWLRFFAYPGVTMLITWSITLLFDLMG